jgi:hypothetical protein
LEQTLAANFLAVGTWPPCLSTRRRREVPFAARARPAKVSLRPSQWKPGSGHNQALVASTFQAVNLRGFDRLESGGRDELDSMQVGSISRRRPQPHDGVRTRDFAHFAPESGDALSTRLLLIECGFRGLT